MISRGGVMLAKFALLVFVSLAVIRRCDSAMELYEVLPYCLAIIVIAGRLSSAANTILAVDIRRFVQTEHAFRQNVRVRP